MSAGQRPASGASQLVVDLFAGPRGWSQGLRQLGLSDVGIEWDGAACKTAMAAGHTATIQADVSRYPTEPFVGKAKGLIASAPCTPFSAAGHGAGKHVMALLARSIVATMSGRNVVAATRTDATRILRPVAPTKRRSKNPRDGYPPRVESVTRAERSAWAREQAFTSCLILEVARWARDLHPEWIACEQVPGVLPLWRVLAHELRKQGYSAWCGVLNAADFGVPQIRKRAFLMASRVRTIGPPAPTHCRGGSVADLFGAELLPHVSMASALGWGATDRPMPTVTSGGTSTGGAEPIARGGRAALAESKRGGAWL